MAAPAQSPPNRPATYCPRNGKPRRSKTGAGGFAGNFQTVNVRPGSGRPAAAADEAHAEQANHDNGERAGFGNTDGADRVELAVELPGDDIVIRAGGARPGRKPDKGVRRTEFLYEIDGIGQQCRPWPNAGRIRPNLKEIIGAVIIDPCGDEASNIERESRIRIKDDGIYVAANIDPDVIVAMPVTRTIVPAVEFDADTVGKTGVSDTAAGAAGRIRDCLQREDDAVRATVLLIGKVELERRAEGRILIERYCRGREGAARLGRCAREPQNVVAMRVGHRATGRPNATGAAVDAAGTAVELQPGKVGEIVEQQSSCAGAARRRHCQSRAGAQRYRDTPCRFQKLPHDEHPINCIMSVQIFRTFYAKTMPDRGIVRFQEVRR